MKNDARRILALDPSTVATGWAVLDTYGRQEGVSASGVYHPPKGTVDERLLAAFNWCAGAIDVHEPQVVAVETPFFKLNARTLTVLASLGAAFRLAAVMVDLPVVEVQPAKRGPALGLAGNATKEQILYVVNAVYNLNLTDHNESDAVAVAAAAALKLRTDAHAAEALA